MTPQHLHRILATLLVSVAATLGLSAAEPFDSFSFLDGPDTSTALPTVCPVDSMASGPVTIEAPDSLPRRRNGKIVIADIDPEILNRREEIPAQQNPRASGKESYRASDREKIPRIFGSTWLLRQI